MRIDADLDPVHSERLKTLLDRLNRPLPEVLGVAIDAALRGLEPEDQPATSPLYEALESIGFIGCIDDDPSLSADYKSHLDFSAKTGAQP
jgi:hypothetical protein